MRLRPAPLPVLPRTLDLNAHDLQVYQLAQLAQYFANDIGAPAMFASIRDTLRGLLLRELDRLASITMSDDQFDFIAEHIEKI